MVILRRQAKDRQRTTSVPLGLVLVLVPKKTSDGEFAAFDPELRSFVDRAAGHELTVFDWTCGRLEFSGELSKVSEIVPSGNFEEMGLPMEKLVERFYKKKRKGFVRDERRIQGGLENALKESSGSRISSTSNPWNSMNTGIPLADSGSSYLIPCLVERNLRRRRTRKRSVSTAMKK